MTLAEILKEGERQLRNYQTMILPHGDARTLLAVARAAVEVVDADESEGWCRTLDARLALRAAVRGDAANGEGR